MYSRIQEILADRAEDLLGHTSETIAKDQLHLPGPDFIDRVMVEQLVDPLGEACAEMTTSQQAARRRG